MRSFTQASRARGSVILIAVITITIITLVAISILSYSSFSYRSSQRKLRLAQLTIVANNDMEYLFYRWSNTFAKPSPLSPEMQLFADTHSVIDSPADTTDVSAEFLSAASPILANTGVLPTLNSLSINRGLYSVSHAQGQVTDDSNITKTGNVKYWTAKTRVQMTDPVLGTMEVRVGRRFTYQGISSVNQAVYYQGDMEFGVNGQMDIYGPVQSNASIYMGAQKATGSTLTIHDSVYYYTSFNGAADNLSGTQYSIQSSASANLSPPTFSTAQATQVVNMPLPDNMTGFNNPNDPTTKPSYIASKFPTAYPNGENDVYRALIAPPPTDASGNVIPESPLVAATRMYTNAGLQITIGPGTQVSVIDPATNSDPSGGAIAAAITGVRQGVYDAREKKQVNMTTVDVAQLANIISTVQTNAGWQFNGVLYVYDKNPSAITPATGQPDLNGIRLINGAKTPNFDYSRTDDAAAQSGTGFTVVSDNGVYVQGDYNTSKNAAPTPATNRTAIMADAVTVLSAGWNDANSTGSIDPTKPLYRGATANLTVNTAILTGNTPSQVDSSGNYVKDTAGLPIQSGGVQNLVRYLEDWYYPSHNTTINGSIAQLFNSKYFTSHYYGTGATNNVYNSPPSRTLEFDSALAASPPNGVPNSLMKYYRGDLFQW